MNTSRKIVSLATLKRKLKTSVGKVVFTNGCFDLLHFGHVDYLEKARSKGDCLIVGLNSDQSIRRIKQKGRPIMTEVSRARVLAGLACVDWVVLFDEETPQQLITSLKPDILVKGSDYKKNEVVGRECVQRVALIPFVQGYSTSNIVKKILKTCQR